MKRLKKIHILMMTLPLAAALTGCGGGGGAGGGDGGDQDGSGRRRGRRSGPDRRDGLPAIFRTDDAARSRARASRHCSRRLRRQLVLEKQAGPADHPGGRRIGWGGSALTDIGHFKSRLRVSSCLVAVDYLRLQGDRAQRLRVAYPPTEIPSTRSTGSMRRSSFPLRI